jgi:hypothetical protein
MAAMKSPDDGRLSARFSETLHRLRERADKGPTTLHDLLECVGPKGHTFLTLFLVLPFMQPIPLPGVSTAFGLVIALVGAFIALGRPPSLPAKLAAHAIDGKTLARICAALERLAVRLEKIIRPRGRLVFRTDWFHRTTGILIFINGVLLSLPLPIPFSNFLPALVLFLASIATLEEDGLVMIGAYIACAATAAFFTAIVYAPYLVHQRWWS